MAGTRTLGKTVASDTTTHAGKSAQILRTRQEVEAVQEEWEEFLADRAGDHTVREQPQFMLNELELESEDSQPFVVIVRDGGIRCIAPFFTLNRRVPLHFGPFEIPTPKVRLLRLIGEHLIHRTESSVTDNIHLVFEALEPLASEFDAVWLPELEVPGEMWDFFSDKGEARAGHRLVVLTPNLEAVQMINLPANFDDYMAGFKGRDRSDRKRQLKKLDKGCGGRVTLTTYTTPAEIRDFFAKANVIRNNSWKAKEFGTNRYDERFVGVHERIAERDWVRGYILNCGDRPIAYTIGYEYAGTFVAKEWAFEESKRSLSPGMGMVLKIFQQLCEAGGCRVLLGPTDNRMKRSIGNATYDVTHAVVVSNQSLRNRFHFAAHRFVARQHKRAVSVVRKVKAVRG